MGAEATTAAAETVTVAVEGGVAVDVAVEAVAA